jgi:predicted phosphodiesterase
MRIALLSDIHGNLVALDATLSDLAQQGVEQVVCLGDIARHRARCDECAGAGRDAALRAWHAALIQSSSAA